MSQLRSVGPPYFAGSRRFPSDLLDLSPPRLTAPQCAYLVAELARNDLHSGEPDGSPDEPLLFLFELVEEAHRRLLGEARFFVSEGAELIDLQPEKPSLLVAVPRILFHPVLSTTLFHNLANGFVQCAQQEGALAPWLTQLRSQLSDIDRPSSNTFNFIRVAFDLGMPVMEWPARQMQVGHGNRAAVLKGSITHNTSSIGVALAKQKSFCKALLAQAGFPVAEGDQVANLNQARQRAQALGFPVAVKPADLDGGEGVSCDIRSREELEQAFQTAQAASANVIVEKHIEGSDYRLLFYGDRLVMAIKRIPGGVTGNGRDSVAELIEQINRDPTRHRGKDAVRYPLDFDDEAELMLRRRGMTAGSVPAEGEFVQLRRAANFSLGGSVEGVEEKEIHPDNLDLCRRAMRLLRLDLAGFDLIQPDIAHSWHDAGGVICEINAQPFIGAIIKKNAYAEILEELVQGDGRIPVVLLVGGIDRATSDTICGQVPQLAVVDAEGARLGGRRLSRPEMPWLEACQAALMDPRTAAALFILDPASQHRTLSPVDRFSAAYLLDAGLPDGEADLPQDLVAMLRRAGGNLAARAEYGAALKRAGLTYRPIASDGLAEELVEALAGAPEPRRKKKTAAVNG